MDDAQVQELARIWTFFYPRKRPDRFLLCARNPGGHASVLMAFPLEMETQMRDLLDRLLAARADAVQTSG